MRPFTRPEFPSAGNPEGAPDVSWRSLFSAGLEPSRPPGSLRVLICARRFPEGSSMNHSIRALLCAAALTFGMAASAQEPPIRVSLDAGKAGARIDRHIFGQFAEHLGRGIYEGVW